MFGNNPGVKEEIKAIKNFELNDTENTTYQNLQDTIKLVLRGKFIAIVFYYKRTEDRNQ